MSRLAAPVSLGNMKIQAETAVMERYISGIHAREGKKDPAIRLASRKIQRVLPAAVASGTSFSLPLRTS